MKLTCIACIMLFFHESMHLWIHLYIESWNNHPVSTERNRTPNQLFIEGTLQQSTCRALPQPSGTPLPSSHDPVQVPRSTFTPCIALKHSLDHVNTVRDSSDFRNWCIRWSCTQSWTTPYTWMQEVLTWLSPLILFFVLTIIMTSWHCL